MAAASHPISFRTRLIVSAGETGRGGTSQLARSRVERVKGIEPSYAAWEAAVLPLNYTRVERRFYDVCAGRSNLRRGDSAIRICSRRVRLRFKNQVSCCTLNIGSPRSQ